MFRTIAAVEQYYFCEFDDGNLCGLRQEVGDSTDWWLVNASFVQLDSEDDTFKDHTTNSDEGKYIKGVLKQYSCLYVFIQYVYRKRFGLVLSFNVKDHYIVPC